MPQASTDQTRNTDRVQISFLPSDLRDLDEYANEIAEPGLKPDRSKALRKIIAEWRSRRKKSRKSGTRQLTQS